MINMESIKINQMVSKLKSQHQKELKYEDECYKLVSGRADRLEKENQKLKTMNKVLGFRFNNVVKAHKIVVKELSECREDNIKLTKEIQEQDKELSDLREFDDRRVVRLERIVKNLKEKKK